MLSLLGKENRAQGLECEYFDLDTAEGLAEAAYHGILGKDIVLPVVVDE